MHLLEICCDSLTGAIAARNGGAQRVELCSALDLGGLTPSHGAIKEVRAALSGSAAQLHVLVRPRGGDFVYTQPELQVIREDISAAKALGADGVVCGFLVPEGSVDVSVTAQAQRQCDDLGLSLTFHRAFDMVRDQGQELERLVVLGVQRVLTSGGEASALQGYSAIAALVKQAAGRIVVMAGGGVRSENVLELVANTGVQEVHSSARRQIASSMTHANPRLSLAVGAMPSDTVWWEASEDEVRGLATALGMGDASKA